MGVHDGPEYAIALRVGLMKALLDTNIFTDHLNGVEAAKEKINRRIGSTFRLFSLESIGRSCAELTMQQIRSSSRLAFSVAALQ
jgi:hypothetical protein